MISKAISKAKKSKKVAAQAEPTNEVVINISDGTEAENSQIGALVSYIRRYGRGFASATYHASTALDPAKTAASQSKTKKPANYAASAENLHNNVKALSDLSSFSIDRRSLAKVKKYDQSVYDDITNASEALVRMWNFCGDAKYFDLLGRNIAPRLGDPLFASIRREEIHKQNLQNLADLMLTHGEVIERMCSKALLLDDLATHLVHRNIPQGYERGFGALFNMATVLFTLCGHMANMAHDTTLIDPFSDNSESISDPPLMALTHVVSPASYSACRAYGRVSPSRVVDEVPGNTAYLLAVGTSRHISETDDLSAVLTSSSKYSLYLLAKSIPHEVYTVLWVAEAIRRLTSYMLYADDTCARPNSVALAAALYTSEPDFDQASFDYANSGITIAKSVRELSEATAQFATLLHYAADTELFPTSDVAENFDIWDTLVPYLCRDQLQNHHQLSGTGRTMTAHFGLAFAPPQVNERVTSLTGHNMLEGLDTNSTLGAIGPIMLRPNGVNLTQRWIAGSYRSDTHAHAIMHSWLITALSGLRYLEFSKCVVRPDNLTTEFVPQLCNAATLHNVGFSFEMSKLYHELNQLSALRSGLVVANAKLSKEVLAEHGLPSSINILVVHDASPVYIPLIPCADHNGFICAITPLHRDTQKFFLDSYSINSQSPMANNYLSHAGSSTRRALLQPNSSVFQDTLQDMLAFDATGYSVRGRTPFEVRVVEPVDFNAYFRGVTEEGSAPSEYNLFLKILFGPSADIAIRNDFWKYWHHYTNVSLLSRQAMGTLLAWDGRS